MTAWAVVVAVLAASGLTAWATNRTSRTQRDVRELEVRVRRTAQAIRDERTEQ